ncbi:MAG: CDP-diacylglycerol--glycerol-3-phosphate 3-phosphatidyltransferase [Spirochaetales bacterium]|nr:CDP-diacylglycerol--glycerol-3-phosphate 3-phosphatidyltransferase [Spirochaetales bacterium]
MQIILQYRAGIVYNFMTQANKVTILRIILSPVFFILFFVIDVCSAATWFLFIILWILFIAIELSDLFDGILARRRNEESELGKVLDPFADSFSRLTYFICFTGMGFMPVWILLVLVYRDITVSFIRLFIAKRGIMFGSRWSGKIKAWFYACAGITGMIYFSLRKLLMFPQINDIVTCVKEIVFILCAVIAVISVIDYSSVFWQHIDKKIK